MVAAMILAVPGLLVGHLNEVLIYDESILSLLSVLVTVIEASFHDACSWFVTKWLDHQLNRRVNH